MWTVEVYGNVGAAENVVGADGESSRWILTKVVAIIGEGCHRSAL